MHLRQSEVTREAKCAQWNILVRSCSHCCRGKSMYYLSVCL